MKALSSQRKTYFSRIILDRISKKTNRLTFLSTLALLGTLQMVHAAPAILSDAVLPNYYDEAIRGERNIQVAALTTPTPRQTTPDIVSPNNLDPKIVSAYGAPINCLPSEIKQVLRDVAVRFGPVSVLSSHRDQQRNRRAGGARESYHLSCRAVDFRVKGANPRKVRSYIEQHPNVGGRKLYAMGFIHIDNGPVRTWAERRGKIRRSIKPRTRVAARI